MPGIGQRDAAVHFAVGDRVDVVGEQGPASGQLDVEPQPGGAGVRRTRRCSRSPSARGSASSGSARSTSRARARARPSARCPSCADTRSSAARAASPACRAASRDRPDRRRPEPRPGTSTRSPTACGDVEGERRVAALVRPNEVAVHPDCGAVVDRAEVKEYSRGLAGRDLERAPIPRRPMEVGVADAAGRRLRRERHDDAGVPFDGSGIVDPPVEIDGEIPAAIERHPAVAHELWTGIAPRLVEVWHGRRGANVGP